MEIYIKGKYKRSIYESDKGYIIGLIRVKETNIDSLEVNKTITFTGYFHELKEDENYIFYGEEVEHPRYGYQFNVTEYERLKPTDEESLITFFSSDLFKGVGETLAKSIVDTLGMDAVNEILNDKACLYMVPKITAKKADSIYKTIVKYEESSSTIVYLNELGLNTKDALTVYNEYKGLTLDVINSNIYKLVEDISDITFTKIDNIYQNTGMEKDDKRRIKATIIYIMNELTFKTGDSYLLKEDIINSVNGYLKFNIEEYDSYFEELESERKIRIYNDAYYLYYMWEAEDYISNKVCYLTSKDPKEIKNIDALITSLENDYNITYNPKQIQAITKAITNNILVITGGPGTGKTTIIKAIIQIYAKIYKLTNEEMINEIALLAPTGRASKRMSENANFLNLLLR